MAEERTEFIRYLQSAIWNVMSAETVILLKYDDNTSQPSVRNYCRGGIILKTTGDAKLLME